MTGDVKTLLKTKIQAKAIEAFNNTPEMLEKLVEAAVSSDVSQHGRPFMEWLGEEIFRAVTDAVLKHVEDHKEAFKSLVEEAVTNPDFETTIGKTVADMLSTDAGQWMFK